MFSLKIFESEEDDFQKLVLNERNEVKHSLARDELRMDDSTESE